MFKFTDLTAPYTTDKNERRSIRRRKKCVCIKYYKRRISSNYYKSYTYTIDPLSLSNPVYTYSQKGSGVTEVGTCPPPPRGQGVMAPLLPPLPLALGALVPVPRPE